MQNFTFYVTGDLENWWFGTVLIFLASFFALKKEKFLNNKQRIKSKVAHNAFYTGRTKQKFNLS